MSGRMVGYSRLEGLERDGYEHRNTYSYRGTKYYIYRQEGYLEYVLLIVFGDEYFEPDQVYSSLKDTVNAAETLIDYRIACR